MKKLLFPVCLLGCSVALTLACGDDVDVAQPGPDSGVGGQVNQPDASGGSGGMSAHPTEDAGVCAALGTLCHDFDTGNGDLGDQCHDAGHVGDPEACAEIYDDCVAFCSSDAGHHDEDGGDAGHPASAVCEEIGHLCHDFDTGDSGLGHECHEVGHAGDEAACLAIQADCLALCGGDGGHHGDGGHVDAALDAGDGG
ncbi:MAG TPA: hypothetical protein VHO25_13265 [Polyangiaceae bacterium]|nr:hypothetical protein [Polyangiaceae bacterium]